MGDLRCNGLVFSSFARPLLFHAQRSAHCARTRAVISAQSTYITARVVMRGYTKLFRARTRAVNSAQSTYITARVVMRGYTKSHDGALPISNSETT